ISMHPLRALISDILPQEQQGLGYAMQTFLIGIGAIIGSLLPYMLAEYFKVAKVAPAGIIPTNVSWSFYIGAAIILICLLWTLITVKETRPKHMDTAAMQPST